MKTLKIAAYLDDAGEDPVAACKVLKHLNIHYAVLRRAWTSNILDLSDRGCNDLRKILYEHSITPIALITTLGEKPATELSIDDKMISRAFNLTVFFKTPLIRIQIGTRSLQPAEDTINNWLNYIKQQSIIYNVTPMFEITNESYYRLPTEIATLFSTHGRWRLLYDPVQLILKQSQDPFVRFWTLLKNRVAAIDVRDYKIGRGFKPVGFGNSNILLTMIDAINTQYNGWFFLEPSLGRKHGSHNTKKDVFKMAYETLNTGLQSKLNKTTNST